MPFGSNGIRTWGTCGDQIPDGPARSSGNQVAIHFGTRWHNTQPRRGFKLRWDALQPATCGGTIDLGTLPVVLSPHINATSGNYSAHTLCKWRISSGGLANSGTTVFSAEKLYLQEPVSDGTVGYCHDKLKFLGGGGSIDDGVDLGTHCGRTTEKLSVASPFGVNYVVFSSGMATIQIFFTSFTLLLVLRHSLKKFHM